MRHGFVVLALVAACGKAPGAYDIEVDGMDELCLLGAGDPAWAARVVAEEGLALSGPRPRLTLCATRGAFGGLAFAEAIFAVELAPEGDQQASMLVHAVNSRATFAWIERVRNLSPYTSGEVDHSTDPAGIRLAVATAAGRVVAASRGAPVTLAPAPSVFEGKIHQPGRSWFGARLEGGATTAPFDPAVDRFEVGEDAADPLAAALRASGFVPDTWFIRPTAKHAKDDTVVEGG